jgi:hypothetical protein
VINRGHKLSGLKLRLCGYRMRPQATIADRRSGRKPPWTGPLAPGADVADLSVIAGLYLYAVEEELLEHSPAAHVRRPRLDWESQLNGYVVDGLLFLD